MVDTVYTAFPDFTHNIDDILAEGDKVIARKIMAEAGISMVPGTPNLSAGDTGVQEALDFAAQHGYPIMLKATAGGAVTWLEGSGESTGLDDGSADWLMMASSFHWTDPSRSIPEFGRVIKPGRTLVVCSADVTVRKHGREILCATLLQTLMTMHGRPDAA